MALLDWFPEIHLRLIMPLVYACVPRLPIPVAELCLSVSLFVVFSRCVIFVGVSGATY